MHKRVTLIHCCVQDMPAIMMSSPHAVQELLMAVRDRCCCNWHDNVLAFAQDLHVVVSVLCTRCAFEPSFAAEVLQDSCDDDLHATRFSSFLCAEGWGRATSLDIDLTLGGGGGCGMAVAPHAAVEDRRMLYGTSPHHDANRTHDASHSSYLLMLCKCSHMSCKCPVH